MSVFPGNPGADMFRELVSAIRYDAAQHQVDLTAANLAAYIGREGRTCVALDRVVPSQSVRAALDLLHGYGVTEEIVRRAPRDSYYVLELEEPKPSEFDCTQWRATQGFSPLRALVELGSSESYRWVQGQPRVNLSGDAIDRQWSATLMRGTLCIQNVRGQDSPFEAIDALAEKAGLLDLGGVQ
jgi:hypothetical protein